MRKFLKANRRVQLRYARIRARYVLLFTLMSTGFSVGLTMFLVAIGATAEDAVATFKVAMLLGLVYTPILMLMVHYTTRHLHRPDKQLAQYKRTFA